LNPRTRFAMNWHVELIAAKLMAVRDGRVRRLVVNLPPRDLKPLLASIAFPAWCLGHDPSAQLLCVSYAQDLADKLSHGCRQIVASGWCRAIFPARLSPQRAGQPFDFELHQSLGGKPTISRSKSASELFSSSARRLAISLVIVGPLVSVEGLATNP
jgi:hypothetical protein